MSVITVTSPEDNGNIEVIEANNQHDIQVKIRGDNNRPEFFQWFNMLVKGIAKEEIKVVIKNAKAVKYPDWNAYQPYKTYASYGNDHWFEIDDTVYDENTGELSMSFTLEQEEIQLAFFPPYSYEKHLRLIDSARNIPHCTVTSLGKTNGEDGRDITLLTFGAPSPHKKEIWIIARQHPGEPQAEWYAESVIEQLQIADPDLFLKYTFRVVPNMNPDGTYLGNLRTNKEGQDLNRMWQNPTREKSPEVFYVLQKMQETGVDFFLDLHSDEVIPRAFIDEAHLSCPESHPQLEWLERLFMNLYMRINPDMQNELNYGPKDRTAPENMTLAAMQVGRRFNCPSFTLEMPTKQYSWQKCKDLGASLLPVLEHFSPKLFHKNTLKPIVALSFLTELKQKNASSAKVNEMPDNLSSEPRP